MSDFYSPTPVLLVQSLIASLVSSPAWIPGTRHSMNDRICGIAIKHLTLNGAFVGRIVIERKSANVGWMHYQPANGGLPGFDRQIKIRFTIGDNVWFPMEAEELVGGFWTAMFRGLPLRAAKINQLAEELGRAVEFAL